MFSNLIRFLIVIILLSNPVSARADNKDNFEVDFNYGFNKFYIEDNEVSTQIKVVNKYEDLEGKLELLVNVSSDENKKVYSAYSEDLFISKGSDKTVDINFFPSHDKNLVLRILDESGQIVWSDDTVLEDAQSPSNVNIAVLSDYFDKFSSLNNIPISATSDINKVGDDTPYISLANLNDMFPMDRHLLKSLNMIIIDDYNTETLDDSQIDALKSWVEDGGALVIGTGVNFQKTIKGLSTLTGHVDNTDETLHINLGDGNVTVLPFSLSGEDRDTVLDLVHKYVDLGGYDSNTDIYGEFNDFINYIPSISESSIDYIKLLFVVLIFLLIFVTYFILKEIGKLNMIWIVMPLVSLFFLVFMHISGSSYTLESSAVSSVSITYLTNNVNFGRTNSITALLSSGGKRVSLSSDKDQHIYMNNLGKSIDFSNYDDGNIALYNSLRFGRESDIGFENSEDFKGNLLRSEEETILDIRTDNIDINSKKIRGKIVNDSDIDLEDIVLLYGNSYFHIGDISRKSFKSLDINLEGRKDFIFGGDIASQIYPVDTSNDSVDILDNLTKSNILSHEFNRFSSKNDVSLTLMSWSVDSLTKDLKVNGNVVDRVDRNLIFIPFGDFVSRDSLDIPFGVFKAEVTEYPGMNIATYKPKRFSGNGNVIYAFMPWRNLDMDKFSFDEVNVSLQKEVSEGKVTPYLYNYSTLNWDEQDGDVLKVNESNKNIYYDDEYGVKISLEPSDAKVLIEEPLISANFTTN